MGRFLTQCAPCDGWEKSTWRRQDLRCASTVGHVAKSNKYIYIFMYTHTHTYIYCTTEVKKSRCISKLLGFRSNSAQRDSLHCRLLVDLPTAQPLWLCSTLTDCTFSIFGRFAEIKQTDLTNYNISAISTKLYFKLSILGNSGLNFHSKAYDTEDELFRVGVQGGCIVCCVVIYGRICEAIKCVCLVQNNL